MRYMILILMLVMVVGCSNSVAVRSESGKVAGKLVSGDGQKVGNVGLTLQPLDSGFVTTLQVAEDGSFEGEIIPGKYAYFVGKSEAKNADQAIKKVDPMFYEANMTRTVDVQPGKELRIELK